MNQTNRISWGFAFVVGSLLNISLFLILPSLGRTEPPAPAPIITLDFVEWQQPVKQKKPVTKPKPRPKKVVKKKTEPKQQLKKPTPKLVDKPKPKPIEKPVFTEEPEPELPKETPPKPVEPEPIIEEPVVPEIVATDEEIIEEEVLPTPTPVFQLTSMPRMIHRETPNYPPTMRAQGKEGTVKLEVLIDKTGKIRKITVLKSAGDAFDQAAIAAISGSSFTAGNINGKPVAVLLRVPVKFKLR